MFLNLQLIEGRYVTYEDVPAELKGSQYRKAPDKVDGKDFPGAGRYWRVSPFTSQSPWMAVVPDTSGEGVPDAFIASHGPRPGSVKFREMWPGWSQMSQTERADVLFEWNDRLADFKGVGTPPGINVERDTKGYKDFGLGDPVYVETKAHGWYVTFPHGLGGLSARFTPRTISAENGFVQHIVAYQARLLSMGVPLPKPHPNLPKLLEEVA